VLRLAPLEAEPGEVSRGVDRESHLCMMMMLLQGVMHRRMGAVHALSFLYGPADSCFLRCSPAVFLEPRCPLPFHLCRGLLVRSPTYLSPGVLLLSPGRDVLWPIVTMVRAQVLIAAAAASCLVAHGHAWAPTAMFAGSAPALRTTSRAGAVPSLCKSAGFVAAPRRTRAALAPRMAVVAETIPKVSMPAQAKQEWEVHKFGGASLNDAALYKTVGDLLVEESKGRGDGAIPTMAIV